MHIDYTLKVSYGFSSEKQTKIKPLSKLPPPQKNRFKVNCVELRTNIRKYKTVKMAER